MLPLVGVLSLAAVFVKAWHDYSQSGFNYERLVVVSGDVGSRRGRTTAPP
jgi:hypothetical protein